MKTAILLLFYFISTFSFGQITNRWQPDSIYANRNVKKIYVYLNSPKDLSQIVEFDKYGKRIRVEKYSASYNRRTRKYKSLDIVGTYKYNSKNLLIEIIETRNYSKPQIEKTIFEYNDNDVLISQKLLKENYRDDYRIITYSYSPYRTNLVVKNDTMITLNKTFVYDKDFYVSRSYGYYYQPTVRYETAFFENEEYQKQINYLVRFDTDLYYNNTFDNYDRLINSDLKAISENKIKDVYELKYKYYKNGLLKSVRGYVPRFFKYEFWE